MEGLLERAREGAVFCPVMCLGTLPCGGLDVPEGWGPGRFPVR